MSRIDKLIAELAPDSVPHVALSEVAEYSSTRVDAAELDETSFVGVDNLVSDKGGRVDASYLPNTARLTAYESGDILLGNIRPYLKKVWIATNSGGCSGDVLAVRVLRKHRDSLDPAFLYYLLSSDNFFAYSMRHAKGAKMPRGSKSAILSYRIPVPPLEVQREIVRVLDQFAQLEAELEAELEARRRQYEHYRHLELTFESTIPRVLLGEIAEVRNGWGFPNTQQGCGDGDYPFYKVSDMNRLGNETVMDGANNYVSKEVAKQLGVRPAPRGTVIFPKIGAAVATNKKRVLSRPSAYDNNVMGVIPSEAIESRFLYHWLQTYDLRKLANDSGAVPSIRKSEAEQLLVPLPQIGEQRRIVAVLDSFDALVNDLNDGLPAEIAARRKQYEYYRDKILTFKEAAA